MVHHITTIIISLVFKTLSSIFYLFMLIIDLVSSARQEVQRNLYSSSFYKGICLSGGYYWEINISDPFCPPFNLLFSTVGKVIYLNADLIRDTHLSLSGDGVIALGKDDSLHDPHAVGCPLGRPNTVS